jgi:hypothetical protein
MEDKLKNKIEEFVNELKKFGVPESTAWRFITEVLMSREELVWDLIEVWDPLIEDLKEILKLPGEEEMEISSGDTLERVGSILSEMQGIGFDICEFIEGYLDIKKWGLEKELRALSYATFAIGSFFYTSEGPLNDIILELADCQILEQYLTPTITLFGTCPTVVLLGTNAVYPILKTAMEWGITGCMFEALNKNDDMRRKALEYLEKKPKRDSREREKVNRQKKFIQTAKQDDFLNYLDSGGGPLFSCKDKAFILEKMGIFGEPHRNRCLQLWKGVLARFAHITPFKVAEIGRHFPRCYPKPAIKDTIGVIDLVTYAVVKTLKDTSSLKTLLEKEPVEITGERWWEAFKTRVKRGQLKFTKRLVSSFAAD